MSYLAYDRARLEALVAAAERSLGEAHPVRLDDPFADDALRSLRAFTGELELTWLPVARRVLAADPLAARSTLPRLEGLADALVHERVTTFGWSLAADWAAPALTPMTVDEAQALADRLDAVDAPDLARDAGELRLLTRRLEEIARDPVLSAAFLERFQQWAPVGDALGRQRALLAAARIGSDTTLADLDAAFAALAHVQRAVLPSNSDALHTTALPWITEMNPYAAALIVREMGLAGDALATTAWRVLQGAPLIRLDDLPGPNSADFLLPLLEADHPATTRFLQLVAERPELLFEAVEHTSDAQAFVLRATDPARMPAAEAGAIIPVMLAHFRDLPAPCDDACQGIGQPEPPGPFLVDLVAPWMLQMSPGNTEWALSNDERNSLLGFVLGSDASLQRFIERADRVEAGFVQSLRSSTLHTLDEMAAFVAMIGEYVMSDAVSDAADRASAWKLLDVLGMIVTTAVPLAAVAVGVSLALAVVHTEVVPSGALAERRAGIGADLAATATGATVAARIVEEWIADGTLPPDFPPPPPADAAASLPSQQFILEFAAWRELLPGGPEGPLSDHIVRYVYAVVNPSMMGAHSRTLFAP